MTSVIMAESAKHGLGKVVGSRRITDADRKAVAKMRREFERDTSWRRIK